MKQELIWQLPIAGLACKMMGYPFMKRHSKEYLKKHPQKKGDDLKATLKSCDRFKVRPTSIVCFAESTRYTDEKRSAQDSPYRHLLKLRTGGVAFMLAALGDRLQKIIDTTIVYKDNQYGVWDFLCGRCKKVTVRYKVYPIEKPLTLETFMMRSVRAELNQWLTKLWVEKDELLSGYLVTEEQE